jgi:hypothetical protein
MEKTLYVVSLFWRNCDPFLSVAGFDQKTVKSKADELANEELDRATEENLEASDNPEAIDESDVRSNLESDLCSTGVNRFEYPADVETLGLDPEHVHELEQDGITVYGAN